ncbi:MAG: ankyrin repeat domain-containing protein [Candidatus Endonucleobacter bathymodioli]|uniref:Ankyrin repeat domain-containing protein n=1 Tax=Candidatus Endonucleibacter bathymodioli TaxID=539814 RepID=A0AA90SNL8_9GAMM|nr:ankyrin repeat domain-containing protein [Candidatus Endonucleobacter bathymodioli]
MTNAQKEELLAGKNADGCSALYIACQYGRREIVTILMAAIFSNLDLTNAQKAELLAAKDADGCSALYIACKNGHPETVTALFTALFTAICNGDINLSHAKKQSCLLGKMEMVVLHCI